MQTNVILVDENDNQIGTAEKLYAHERGLRHRAFSVFLLRQTATGQVELLLQQRQSHKYHSANLWTNTCCSHPKPDEGILTAGQRRLKEEMGISAQLHNLGWFHYEAKFKNGLTENEIDYVLVGEYIEQPFVINQEEVKAYHWIDLEILAAELLKDPHKYTPWFKQALDHMHAHHALQQLFGMPV